MPNDSPSAQIGYSAQPMTTTKESNAVLMVRPRDFHCNPQTILDNHFQSIGFDFTRDEIEMKIQAEFDEFVGLLRAAGINVTIFEQSDDQDTPDAIFPNNWFSTHFDRKLVLYPMKALNRRLERRKEIIDWLSTRYTETIDLSAYENQGRFLEGTGSLVIDHDHRSAFAAISDRTHPKMVLEWGRRMGYEIQLFSASDKNSNPIYHTNVVMTLGRGFALVGLDAINSAAERKAVYAALSDTGREIIELTTEQIHFFSGNGLQLVDKNGDPLFVLSKNGWNALTEPQKIVIRSLTEVVTPSLNMTEQLGGGSARCMIAELF